MFDLKKIWLDMSLPNKAITGAILLMAVLAMAVTFERVVALSKSAKVSRQFAAKADRLVSSWELSSLLGVAKAHGGSSLARLCRAIVEKYLEVRERGEMNQAGIDLVRNEAARQQEIVSADLRRGMSILATIGSIAPFVGLLGTVVGIIAAFQKIGAANAGGIGTVSSQIGEALIETAIGLGVAIPAVIFFNYLSGRVGGVEAALGRSAGQLIDEMEYRHAHSNDRESGEVDTRKAA